MMYAPRTIAFITELFHPPLPPDPNPIQKVHNRLFEGGDPAYRSFAVSPTGAVLSNPGHRPGAVSSAAFLTDRMQFREELGSLTVEEFGARVTDIARLVAEERGIQVFTAQHVTVRTLINPRSYKDSREFMRQGMFGFEEQPSDFGRDPQLYGIRLVFPPGESNPNQHSLRIESFSGDSRSIFIENHAGFPPILVGRGLEQLAGNVDHTYGFLVERALLFIKRFDSRGEDEA